MSPDFKELLSLLNPHNVSYLIVGAHAVAAHAQPRATKDLDIWVKPDVPNGKAVFAALAQFGAPLKGLTFACRRARAFVPHAPGSPLPSIFLFEIPGVEFDGAWERGVEDVIDTTSGLRAIFNFPRRSGNGQTRRRSPARFGRHGCHPWRRKKHKSAKGAARTAKETGTGPRRTPFWAS
jgi:hypothetical protein